MGFVGTQPILLGTRRTNPPMPPLQKGAVRRTGGFGSCGYDLLKHLVLLAFSYDSVFFIIAISKQEFSRLSEVFTRFPSGNSTFFWHSPCTSFKMHDWKRDL